MKRCRCRSRPWRPVRTVANVRQRAPTRAWTSTSLPPAGRWPPSSRPRKVTAAPARTAGGTARRLTRAFARTDDRRAGGEEERVAGEAGADGARRARSGRRRRTRPLASVRSGHERTAARGAGEDDRAAAADAAPGRAATEALLERDVAVGQRRGAVEQPDGDRRPERAAVSVTRLRSGSVSAAGAPSVAGGADGGVARGVDRSGAQLVAARAEAGVVDPRDQPAVAERGLERDPGAAGRAELDRARDHARRRVGDDGADLGRVGRVLGLEGDRLRRRPVDADDEAARGGRVARGVDRAVADLVAAVGDQRDGGVGRLGGRLGAGADLPGHPRHAGPVVARAEPDADRRGDPALAGRARRTRRAWARAVDADERPHRGRGDAGAGDRADLDRRRALGHRVERQRRA